MHTAFDKIQREIAAKKIDGVTPQWIARKILDGVIEGEYDADKLAESVLAAIARMPESSEAKPRSPAKNDQISA
jgi:hypothetical protein